MCVFDVDSLFLVVFVQVTSHPEPVSQSMSLQQPPQSQYNMPDRDKQLLFSEFEDLSASFRSLYKSVFEQSFSQQGEWPSRNTKWKPNGEPQLSGMEQDDCQNECPNVCLFLAAGAIGSP